MLNLAPEGRGGVATPANLKLQRSVRIFASNYLQENLLTLQNLPTRIQLRKIRDAKEKEAEELRRNLIRQKEEQRLLEEEAAAAIASKRDNKPTAGAPTNSMDASLMNKLDSTFKDTIEMTFSALGIGSSKGGTNTNEPSVGWSAAPVISDTLGDEFDPFELQRQQLLSYIEQARDAKKFDEVEALEQSLAEIESMMGQTVTF